MQETFDHQLSSKYEPLKFCSKSAYYMFFVCVIINLEQNSLLASSYDVNRAFHPGNLG